MYFVVNVCASGCVANAYFMHMNDIFDKEVFTLITAVISSLMLCKSKDENSSARRQNDLTGYFFK